MRKILLMLCLIIGLSNSVYANDDYEFIGTYYGAKYYVDNTSIISVAYNPPFYRLASGILINYLDGSADYQIYKWSYCYDKVYEKRRMYVLTIDSALSYYIPRYDEKSEDFFYRSAGEYVWKSYYIIDFYRKEK